MEFFEVGGCVRDEILGKPSKDIDFSVVAPSFEAMREAIAATGMKIVVETPEHFTIRAVAKQPFQGHTGGLDFVWARKDGPYSDGRRPDFVEPGTLMDDLARRDFTMNAIAKDAEGRLIDPFFGISAIHAKVIKAVGSAEDRLFEDALRGLRAIRFAVTKGFSVDRDIVAVLGSPRFAQAMSSISKDRQRDEVEKMLAHNTLDALNWIAAFPTLFSAVFTDGLRLSATMKG